MFQRGSTILILVIVGYQYVSSTHEEIKELKDILMKIQSKLEKHDKNKCQTTGKETTGSVYIRWGVSKCGNNQAHTTLIYAGQAGGSYWQHEGAAVNYLCLPDSPIWEHYDSNENNDAWVVGAEIETHEINIPGTPWVLNKFDSTGVVCALCKTVGRLSVVMIPGRNECFPGWTREYYGYLAAGHPSHKAGSEYACLDGKPDVFYHGKTRYRYHINFFPVEARCNGTLKCPPYVNGRELTCVVCSQ